jgi:hypothetical protein
MSEGGTTSKFTLELYTAGAAVCVVIALQCLLINELAVGTWWLAPALEFALLVTILVTASSSSSGGGRLQLMAFVLIAFITIVNLVALIDLLRALMTGRSEVGTTLLLDAVNVWTTNVIAFALVFWCVDRSGPLAQPVGRYEFLFPQHTLGDGHKVEAFAPGFIDYLFLSFTTATAFSPTDTAPLTQKMKLLMMTEASISFLTVAFVAARAVNILA